MNRRLKKMEKSIRDLRSPVMSIDSSPYKVKSCKATLLYTTACNYYTLPILAGNPKQEDSKGLLLVSHKASR